MNKSDLARIAGVTPGSVTKWQHGGRITISPAIRLSEALRLPLSDLVSDSEDEIRQVACKKGSEGVIEKLLEYGALRENPIDSRTIARRLERLEAQVELLAKMIACPKEDNKGEKRDE